MSSSRRPRPPIQTLDRPTPHALSILRHSTTPNSQRKKLPKSRTELDVLIAHHKFLRTTTTTTDEGNDEGNDKGKGRGQGERTWEEELAIKFYESLFREFAVVNLKHYKSNKIALRWRNEDEVLASIGQRTCGHLRCPHHLPLPLSPSQSTSHSTSHPADEEEEEDETTPLVPTKLYTYQVPFGYVEDGERKSALVKLVLCKDCGRKLNYGKGKRDKEQRTVEERNGDAEEEEGDGYAPSLPPDLERSNRGSSLGRRRRSASPAARPRRS